MAKIYKTNLATDMDVSDYLLILIFQKASSTGPLKNTAPGLILSYIFDWESRADASSIILSKIRKDHLLEGIINANFGLSVQPSNGGFTDNFFRIHAKNITFKEFQNIGKVKT